MDKQYRKLQYLPVIKWTWNLSDRLGDGDMFDKKYTIEKYSSYIEENLASNLWQDFRCNYEKKLESIKIKAHHTECEPLIQDWFSYININKHEETYTRSLKLLNLYSKKILVEVTNSYDKEFDMLIEDCNSYEDFIDVLDFVNELPLYLLKNMKDLLKQEWEESYDRDVGVMQKEKILVTEKEETYKVSKELEYITNSFLFRRLSYCEYRRKAI
ncbi:MAG: hypothetical protein PHX14_06835 [Syntrophomonadaceae bacterium]|nr:hypothetical protein [Syntrophomonadaceae bacterium]